MVYNSIIFFVFFIIVYSLYLWLDCKWQNRMLLVASYVFYGAWDWRFLSLIFISTGIDFFCGLKIFQANMKAEKKFFLIMSMTSNLLILGYFKYANFFLGNFIHLFQVFGLNISWQSLKIILPVGISFYTFQSMSYSIDIYRGELKPTKKFFDFALFVAFFPQLVAGPIERAKRLLPQLTQVREVTPERFTLGVRLILWGLFKKVVVADGLALYVNTIYNNVSFHSSLTFLVATFFFAFQIYCDFSGYSNIAIGLAQMLGIDLMENFKNPYLASNIRDFWRRWHISLSTWLRDYLYIPLGGNSATSRLSTYRNVMITMLLGGLWHGANWTFVFWGALHGTYIIATQMIQERFKNLKKESQNSYSIPKVCNILFTFSLVLVTWVFFRANHLSDAFYIIKSIFTAPIDFFMASWTVVTQGFLCIIFVLLMEFRVRKRTYNDVLYFKSPIIQWALSYILIFGILLFGVETGDQFIYFQF